MSMFPTAGSHIYRNEEGEVLGWSDESSYEPEYCDICGGNHDPINCPNDSYGEDDAHSKREYDLAAEEDDEDPFYGDDHFMERGL